MNESIADKFTFSLNVSFVAMAIVFAILIILWLVIKSQSFLLGGRKDTSETVDTSLMEKSQEKVEPVVETINPHENIEVVAAIMAALSAHIGTPISDLNIKSIKRINSNWQRTSIEDKLNN
ncbi:OadG family protein [Clostridium sp.]|uniref:OadG family protein n=1 Tax=Clostridium sp. TaxID=1506 RepID=UPI002FC733E3